VRELPGWIDRGGEGTGTPIVLLHGFMGDPRDYTTIVEALSATRRVVVPRLPFHGPDPEPVPQRGNGFVAAVDHLAACLLLVGVERAVVAGYSLGGRLALGLLTRHPDRFAGAALLGASPGLADVTERRERADADRDRARELVEDFPAFLDRWYDLPLFDGIRQSASFEEMCARRLEHDPRAVSQALLTMGTGVMPSLWSELAGIDVPVLLVAGERDAKYRRMNESMAGRLPRARVEVVSGCSHAVHVERPDVITNLITTFVEEECDR